MSATTTRGHARQALAIARALTRAPVKSLIVVALFPATWLALVAMETLRSDAHRHVAAIGFFAIPVAAWWVTVRRRLPELIGSLRALALPTPWPAFGGAIGLHVLLLVAAAVALAPSYATLPTVLAAFIAIAGLMVEWPGKTLIAVIAFLLLKNSGWIDAVPPPPLPWLVGLLALVGATGLVRTALRIRQASSATWLPRFDEVAESAPGYDFDNDGGRAPLLSDAESAPRDDTDHEASADPRDDGAAAGRHDTGTRRDTNAPTSRAPALPHLHDVLGWPQGPLPGIGVAVAVLLPVVAWGIVAIAGSTRIAGPIGFAAAFLVVLMGLFGTTGAAITSLDRFGENREAIRLWPRAPRGAVLTRAYLDAWWRRIAQIALAAAPGGALLFAAVERGATPSAIGKVLVLYAAIAFACATFVALVVVVGHSPWRRGAAAMGMIALVALAIVVPSAATPWQFAAVVGVVAVALALMAAARHLPLPPARRGAPVSPFEN